MLAPQPAHAGRSQLSPGREVRWPGHGELGKRRMHRHPLPSPERSLSLLLHSQPFLLPFLLSLPRRSSATWASRDTSLPSRDAGRPALGGIGRLTPLPPEV